MFFGNGINSGYKFEHSKHSLFFGIFSIILIFCFLIFIKEIFSFLEIFILFYFYSILNVLTGLPRYLSSGYAWQWIANDG